MDDKYGLLVMTLFAVVVLVIAPFLKSKPKRNPFIVEIEEWFNSMKKNNKDYESYFKVDFPKKYPEFKQWRETCCGKK